MKKSIMVLWGAPKAGKERMVNGTRPDVFHVDNVIKRPLIEVVEGG